MPKVKFPYTGEEPTKSDTFENTLHLRRLDSAACRGQPATPNTPLCSIRENVPTCNITLTNAIGWDEKRLCLLLKGSQNNAWPGTPLTASDDDYFILNAQIPSNVDGIIFNNGRSDDQLKQTADITEGFKDGAHWAVSLKNNEITVNEVPD